MLNKELLMVGSESLEPVLSIYIAPYINYLPTISGMLSSGKAFSVSDIGETTFKFSEIELTATITVRYYEDAQLSTTNLMSAAASYSGGAKWVPSVIMENYRIGDKTQSASISIT